MKVRIPGFDFSGVQPHWTASKELAQDYNAKSLVPAYIEPFLIQVMRRAKLKLAPEHESLHRDVITFIRQESMHCKYHVDFNDMMRRHYPGMKAIEEEYAAEYCRFLQERSLKFNLAYSEGFEALGAAGAETFFEEAEALLVDADPRALQLWKWHLAEEFEHRHVCSQVYEALFCHGPWNRFWNGYIYRVWAFLYAMKHIGTYVDRLFRHLLEVDRAGLSAAERVASDARLSEMKRRRLGRLKRLLPVLSPFYDPARKPVPVGLNEYLRSLESRERAV